MQLYDYSTFNKFTLNPLTETISNETIENISTRPKYDYRLDPLNTAILVKKYNSISAPNKYKSIEHFNKSKRSKYLHPIFIKNFLIIVLFILVFFLLYFIRNLFIYMQ